MAKKPQATLTDVIAQARRWALLLLVLLPVVSQADVAEIPELGVKFLALPSGVSAFQLLERPAGYEATARQGIFFLSIYRLDEPVPAGSKLRDASYRASIETKLGLQAGSLKRGSAKRLGDYDAWTPDGWMSKGSLIALIGPDWVHPTALYSWTIYAIGDQHLYRVSVNGAGPEATAEFVALVKGVHRIVFGPVQRAPPPPVESAATAPGKMPRFVSGNSDDLYPAPARRLDEQGPVDVEFNIDGQGHVQDVKQTYAAVHDFSAGALQFLHAGVFRVPPDWEATGSDKLRFSMEFQLSLVGPGESCPSKQSPRVVDAYVVGICGSAIARSPPR